MNTDNTNEIPVRTRTGVVRIAGYIILGVSCILFLLIPVVPWLGLSAGKIAGISAGLLIAGEILFYLSLFILGRSFYDKIKSWLKFGKKRQKDPDMS
jgi:hypothetical protein